MAQSEVKAQVVPVSENEVANFCPLSPEEESALMLVDPSRPGNLPEYFQSLPNLRNYILKRPGLVGRRHKYSAERLMMLLDNDRLAALEDEFNEHPRGIKLANFVWLMESAIDYPPEEKVDLVYGLVKLFQDIDINGDLHMEWSEFTQYVIDCVLQEGTVVQENEALGEATPTEVMEQAGGGRGRRFQVSELTDPTPHHNPIRKIVPTGKSDGFFVLEENSAAIKEYNSRLCPIRKIEPARLGLYTQKSTIQSFDYDPTNDIIGFVTSDKKAYFHDGGAKQSLLHVAEKFRRAATGIWHMPHARFWAVSWVDHSITFWRVQRQGLIFLSVANRCLPRKLRVSKLTQS